MPIYSSSEEEDLTPPAPPRPIAPNPYTWLINRPAPGARQPQGATQVEVVDQYRQPIFHEETYGQEAAERLADEQRLSAELGNKTASQQSSILSQPSSTRNTAIGIRSLDFAQKIAGALIGGWASVEQQKELAKNLYKNKKAYVSQTTASRAEFRWDYLSYAILGFAVIGAAIYFLGKKKSGGASSAPAMSAPVSTMLALPAPAKNRGRRRR